MGINDRDYARESAGGGIRPGPGVRARLGGLSVVHWLIIVNCIVFAADHLMGARRVVWQVHMGSALADPNLSDAVLDRSVVDKRTAIQGPGGMFAFPIVDQQTGEIVGQWLWQYMTPLAAMGHFSTGKGFIQLEVWRFVSFQFLHANLSHLLFNMIGLWFFGPIVEEFLGSKKRFLAYYLICGIFGAILYMILNLIGFLLPPNLRVPGVLFGSIYTPLIGASAGVFGVLMACARVAGNAEMLVMFVLPLKIRTGAYLMFLAALINLLAGGSNAGGDAAHVGGAIAGYFFIRRPHLLHEFFDVLGRSAPSRTRPPSPKDEQRLDEILDKVKEHGMHSLTPKERKFLSRQTDAKRGRE